MFIFGLLVGVVAGVMLTGLLLVWVAEWTSQTPIRSINSYKAYDLEPAPPVDRQASAAESKPALEPEDQA